MMLETASSCLDGADFLVILTEWDEFASFDLHLVKSKIKYPLIVDGRNLFDPQAMSNLGLEYHSIGR